MNLLTVGRISPVKGLEEIVQSGNPITIVGEPTDMLYFDKVKKVAVNAKWLGGLSQDEVIRELRKCDIFVSNSQTGSLDKACLEAMACEKLILASNPAIKHLLVTYGEGLAEMLTFSGKEDFENKLKALEKLQEYEKQIIVKELRRIVVENHSISINITQIIGLLR